MSRHHAPRCKLRRFPSSATGTHVAVGSGSLPSHWMAAAHLADLSIQYLHAVLVRAASRWVPIDCARNCCPACHSIPFPVMHLAGSSASDFCCGSKYHTWFGQHAGLPLADQIDVTAYASTSCLFKTTSKASLQFAEGHPHFVITRGVLLRYSDSRCCLGPGARVYYARILYFHTTAFLLAARTYFSRGFGRPDRCAAHGLQLSRPGTLRSSDAISSVSSSVLHFD